jgi:mRNA-degrading endonuclease toxin of MazEF toxin-antitoxin module
VNRSPRRGEMWATDAGIRVLVISSTVYNEISNEPTVVVVPIFDTEPDTGFGVGLGEGWAAVGLVTSLGKARLREQLRRVDVQTLTDVNNMLVKILATPER